VPTSRMREAIPPLLYVYMARCLVKHRNNFTFTFTFTFYHLYECVKGNTHCTLGFLLKLQLPFHQ